MRDSMIFYRSFYEAIKELSFESQGIIYNAIYEYGLNKNEVELKGIEKTIFTLIKPQLDANLRKFNNGNKGGRPPKNNLNETELKPKNNLNETKTKANVNVNVNNNVNNNIFSFDEFWNLYDKKTDRKKCEDKYKKLSLVQIEKIKTALPIYIKSKPDVQYRKNPLTWLNGECWNDEVKLIEQSNVNNNVLFVTPEGIEITDKLVLHTYQQTGFI